MIPRTYLVAGVCLLITVAQLGAQVRQPQPQPTTKPAPAPAPAPTAATRPAAPASAPASAPTTAPRHVLVVPPGFKIVEVEHHSVLLEPADEAWTRAALAKVTPTTLPTTMPTNMLERFAANKEALKKQMIKDLALTDPAIVDKFFKENIEQQLSHYDEIAPPLYYMVTTKARLTELIKGGWSDPRFSYNRAADDIQVYPGVSLNPDSRGDDVLVPTLVEPDLPADQRAQRLTDTIHAIEQQLAGKISINAQVGAQVAFIGFMAKEVLEPLKVKPDQEWFGVGFTGVLSVRYASKLNGMEVGPVLEGLASDTGNNPFRASTIDLLHPTPLNEMRPQAVPYYADAFRRKSTRVVLSWMTRAGEDALPKVLTAMRQSPPADGPALIKLIQQTTNIDLTNDVAVQ